MNFLIKLDSEIKDLNGELLRTREARVDKDFHINFVSQKLNDLIRSLAKHNPDNPAKTLGEALSKVSLLIGESFDHIESVETNIIVTLNAYNKIRDDFIAHENKEKQEAQSNNDNNLDRIRKIGERPVNKLKEREKKRKKKNKSKKIDKG